MTNPKRNPYGVLIGELPYSELDADLRDRLGPEDDSPIDGMRDPRFPGSYLTPTGPGEPGPGTDYENDRGPFLGHLEERFPDSRARGAGKVQVHRVRHPGRLGHLQDAASGLVRRRSRVGEFAMFVPRDSRRRIRGTRDVVAVRAPVAARRVRAARARSPALVPERSERTHSDTSMGDDQRRYIPLPPTFRHLQCSFRV